MYNALDVAKFMLKAAGEQGKKLTHMQLQKLVYIAQGVFLAKHDGKSLLNESVSAWKFGPVIDSIYHEFKKFGSGVVTLSPAELNVDLAENAKDVVSEVLSVFGEYSGTELSSFTHQPDSPWHKVWYNNHGQLIKGTRIPNEVIKAHYDNIFAKGEVNCL
jgi:uncharacterized phage-associated protein